MSSKGKSDDSRCCNHVCCRHCGYEEPEDYEGDRWKYEDSHVLQDGERVYTKDLEALIDSCCPKDKLTLNSKIHHILQQDGYDVLEELSGLGYKMTPCNKKNQTIIHLAYYKESHNVLNYSDGSLLFKLEKDHTNYVDSHGLSHLHVACVTGNTNIVKKFLDKNEDINLQFHSDPSGDKTGFTPLHFAATNECRDIVELLLQRGANVNAKDLQGRTPLHLACGVTDAIDRWLRNLGTFEMLKSTSEIEIIEILLKYGADVHAKDEKGNTPLFNCFQSFRRDMSFMYENKDPRTKELKVRQRKKFEILLKHNADITTINNDNENILHWIVKDLQFLRMPIMYSNISFDDQSHAQLIEQLLAANQELDVNKKSNDGQTPLQLAISLISVDVVKVLLKYDADISKKFNQNKPLQFIYPKVLPSLEAVRNMIDIIDLLSDKEYYFNLKDNLTVCKFLMHNFENCDCLNFKDDYNRRFILDSALCYGPTQHLNKIIQMIKSSKARARKHEIDEMQEHIYFYLDCKRKFGIHDRRFLKCQKPKKFQYNYRLKPLAENLDTEIVRMKTTDLESGTTLYKLMINRNYSKIYKHVKNSEIDKLSLTYKSYEKMIKAHIAKALVRNFIERCTCQYFKSLPLPPLPDLCCNMIAGYLSNEDIFNFGVAIVNS